VFTVYGAVAADPAATAVAGNRDTGAEGASTPAGPQLLACYPNPFNSSVVIPVVLTASARVRLCVHDMAGQRVRMLADRTLAPGQHAVRWDGRNASGHPVASGVYLIRLDAAACRQIRRVALVR